MKSTRICLVSLGCVAGALVFGVVANAAIDLVIPTGAPKAAAAVPSVKAADEAPVPAPFTLASAQSTAVDLGPAKVKTIPILVREGLFSEQSEAAPATTATISVPLPRRRPANAPTAETASLSHQPGSLAITAATRKANPEDGEVLSPAGIERMKNALALTAEQEEFWPAIAAELRALGKLLPKQGKGQMASVHVDKETMERLYWAAAPLITRLSYEQKLKVKQMAHLMGLTQVAEAL